MKIHRLDNVEVNLSDGHKYSLCDIAKGELIMKYGNPIGHATQAIKKGTHVHTHNLATNLSDTITYTYEPVAPTVIPRASDRCFMGYLRSNGDVGIRNDIWIINTVGCVNKIAEKLAALSWVTINKSPKRSCVGW